VRLYTDRKYAKERSAEEAAIAYAVAALVEPHRGWPATVEAAAALLPQSRANRIR
jgi:hypothetical protein